MVLVSDVFVALGLAVVFLVFRENSFTSTLIEVNAGQKVISTDPYSVVRHPMYTGALLMLFFTFGVRFILGTAFFSIFLVISFRIVEEEKFLTKNLPGYKEYTKRPVRPLYLFSGKCSF